MGLPAGQLDVFSCSTSLSHSLPSYSFSLFPLSLAHNGDILICLYRGGGEESARELRRPVREADLRPAMRQQEELEPSTDTGSGFKETARTAEQECLPSHLCPAIPVIQLFSGNLISLLPLPTGFTEMFLKM